MEDSEGSDSNLPLESSADKDKKFFKERTTRALFKIGFFRRDFTSQEALFNGIKEYENIISNMPNEEHQYGIDASLIICKSIVETIKKTHGIPKPVIAPASHKNSF